MYIVNKPTYHINRNCKTISHAFKMGVTECSVTTTKFTWLSWVQTVVARNTLFWCQTVGSMRVGSGSSVTMAA